jgi:hypothetical protein
MDCRGGRVAVLTAGRPAPAASASCGTPPGRIPTIGERAASREAHAKMPAAGSGRTMVLADRETYAMPTARSIEERS